MTIQQLRYIITIAEQGSFNKASEVLYISQPSLTESVKELENELGITIFLRTGRGVTLTGDGVEFMGYAREAYHQIENIRERYGEGESKKKFEIGILYLSDFNTPVIGKLLRSNKLEFHELIACEAYVYLWKGHPLANRESIRFDELAQYPCLSFEQGGNGSMYFAEEILASYPYPRTIRATDRATMLNLMIGLNGFTLCSGIISEEINGSDYIAVPFAPDDEHPGCTMHIGYITKKNLRLSRVGKMYIEELEKYLAPIFNK